MATDVRDLPKVIVDAIKAETETLAEDLIAKFTSEFERKLRKQIPFIACSVSKYYEVMEDRNQILIKVKIEDQK